MSRTLARALAAAILATTAATAFADEPWMVRVRALRLDPADNSDAIPTLAVPADAIRVSEKTIPELDVTYFFARQWAAELVLTVPQKHDVTVAQSALGSGVGIGSFTHLPPTLSIQYHFAPEAALRPYVGAGINYTRISAVKLEIPTVGRLSLDKDSFGPAIGAGLDYKLGPSLYLNVDLKKVWIESDVKLGGAKVSHVKVDPLLYGVGLGWRF